MIVSLRTSRSDQARRFSFARRSSRSRRAVLDAIELETPPAHLLVGPVALQNVRRRLADWSAEIDR